MQDIMQEPNRLSCKIIIAPFSRNIFCIITGKKRNADQCLLQIHRLRSSNVQLIIQQRLATTLLLDIRDVLYSMTSIVNMSY